MWAKYRNAKRKNAKRIEERVTLNEHNKRIIGEARSVVTARYHRRIALSSMLDQYLMLAQRSA